MQAYELLKIPELWIYRQESLTIYILQENSYQDSEKSNLFPDINIKKILPHYVELGWTEGSNIALCQFETLDNFS